MKNCLICEYSTSKINFLSLSQKIKIKKNGKSISQCLLISSRSLAKSESIILTITQAFELQAHFKFEIKSFRWQFLQAQRTRRLSSCAVLLAIERQKQFKYLCKYFRQKTDSWRDSWRWCEPQKNIKVGWNKPQKLMKICFCSICYQDIFLDDFDVLSDLPLSLLKKLVGWSLVGVVHILRNHKKPIYAPSLFIWPCFATSATKTGHLLIYRPPLQTITQSMNDTIVQSDRMSWL